MQCDRTVVVKTVLQLLPHLEDVWISTLAGEQREKLWFGFRLRAEMAGSRARTGHSHRES